jgi:hypothetical protein
MHTGPKLYWKNVHKNTWKWNTFTKDIGSPEVFLVKVFPISKFSVMEIIAL